MVIVKRHVSRIVIFSEIMLFSWFYLISPHGLPAVWRVQKEVQCAIEQNDQIRKELAYLEQQLTDWLQDPFYKEKIAREQLQMARGGDVVYFVD